MNSMVVGLFIAVLLIVIASLFPGAAPMVGFLERVGSLTVACWAIVELIRSVRR